MKEVNFAQNLEKLKQHIPDIDIPDINISDMQPSKRVIYSLDEIKDDTQVICIYGVGSGSDYFKLKRWLQESENRFLVFLDDDLKSFSFFLRQEKACDILDDSKVRFYYLQSPIATEACLKKIAWEFVLFKFQLFIHPGYLEKKQVKSLKSLFNKICLGCFLVASDYSDMGVNVIKNSLKNLADLSKLFILPDKDFFADVPAVICGAGSSIDKIKSKLTHLKDRFLVFSGGSGLNVLSNENTSPHFGAIIDKDSVFEGLIRQNAFQLPQFFQKRASHDCISLIHGEKMLFADSFPYLYEKWIDKQWLDEQGSLAKRSYDASEVEAGWNVVTFLLQIALMLGCKTIVFAGVDLCLKQENFYAKGVEKEALNVKEDTGLIQVKDRNQKQVFTQPDWHLASKYIQEITSKEKYKDRNFFTLSDGLDLGKCVQKITLEQLTSFPSLDLDGRIHTFFQEGGFVSLQKQKMKQIFSVVENQLEKTLENLDSLLLKLEKLYNQGIFEKKFEESLNDPWAVEYLFFPLWTMLKSMFLRADVFSYPTLQKAVFLKGVVESHLKMIQEIQYAKASL